METVLYVLIVLVVVSFVLEKVFKSDILRKPPNSPKGVLPEIGTALKNQEIREQFGRRTLQKKIPHQDKANSIHGQTKKFVTLSQDKQEPVLNICEITAPANIEQGQKDITVRWLVRNTATKNIEISTIQLQFQGKQDLTSEYTVRAQAGNASLLAPNETGEIKVTIEAHPNATIGKVGITAIFLSPDSHPLYTTIVPERSAGTDDTKSIEWQVELGGREFKIITENQGKETAGVRFSLDIQTYRNQQIDPTYTGTHRISFTLQGTSSIAHAVHIPEYLDLKFDRGQAVTPKEFCFYNTLECYAISTKEKKAGGPEGICLPIQLRSGSLETFHLNICSPQTSGVPFQGENTITALDAYSNIKTDYASDTEILCNVDGRVLGLSGTGNILPGSSFNQGLARLTGLAFTPADTGVDALGEEEGKIVQFIASAEDKFGYSDDITMLPAVPMTTSETQAVIQRLLGFRKRKIWIVNCEEEVTRLFTKSFEPKFEVVAMSLTPDQVEQQFTSSSYPDIVFIDSSVPPRDGYQVLETLRKLPYLEGLQILFLGSPSIAESKISEILRSGSVYLAKPISIPAVRAIVTELLEQISLAKGRLPVQGARLPGSEGNSYQIIGKIGEGGMGYIYEARRIRDHQKVIIKYLPPRDLSNIKSIVRFVQEAHAVLSFHHENLVCGYDLFMDRNRCFYVMEFIEGESLDKYLHDHGRLEPAHATRIILQSARALQALEEEHQLVHRDIKPANILITPEGLVKLVDFGIAKVTNHKLTTIGIILGTPYYLSPEQIQGRNITIQSDIYSLGATFYHIVTGELPFQGGDVYSIIHQRLKQSNLRYPRDINPTIPKTIADIIVKMMQLKTRRRYANPKELIHDLENVLQCIDSGSLALEEIPMSTYEDETSEDTDEDTPR